MILSSIRFSIPSKKRAEALKILKMAAEHCKILPECLSCHIYEDVHDINILMLRQTWRCKEDMEEYLRSNEYRNILLVMEMATTEPEVRFDAVSDSTGIETVEKARMYKRL
jgi:quinol monooxygenase YgiN